MVRILPLRSKKKGKGRDSVDKVSQLHNFALGKKSRCSLMNILMYNLKINFRVMRASTTSEQSPFCVAGQRSAGPYTLADARDLKPGAGKITSQRVIEARFLSGDDYFDWYWGCEASTRMKCWQMKTRTPPLTTLPLSSPTNKRR